MEWNRPVGRGTEWTTANETKKKIFLKQNKRCVYTGEELHFRRTSYDYEYDTASLDRIDSNKGYVNFFKLYLIAISSLITGLIICKIFKINGPEFRSNCLETKLNISSGVRGRTTNRLSIIFLKISEDIFFLNKTREIKRIYWLIMDVKLEE